MPRAACSFDGQRSDQKLATAYWAWFNADGARTAWKVRYCVDHARTNLLWLFSPSSEPEEEASIFACRACGTDCTEDSDPIYCTLFLPKRDRMDFECQMCGACAAKVRITIVDVGEKQPDRNGKSTFADVDAWAAIGVQPKGVA